MEKKKTKMRREIKKKYRAEQKRIRQRNEEKETETRK